MKAKIAILACVLLALAGLSIIVPATARSALETKACPGDICIINAARFFMQSPNRAETVFMCSAYELGCEACCNYCASLMPEKIIGKAQYCGCQWIEDYNTICDTSPEM